jgi:hypothetical protein
MGRWWIVFKEIASAYDILSDALFLFVEVVAIDTDKCKKRDTCLIAFYFGILVLCLSVLLLLCKAVIIAGMEKGKQTFSNTSICCNTCLFSCCWLCALCKLGSRFFKVLAFLPGFSIFTTMFMDLQWRSDYEGAERKFNMLIRLLEVSYQPTRFSIFFCSFPSHHHHHQLTFSVTQWYRTVHKFV